MRKRAVVFRRRHRRLNLLDSVRSSSDAQSLDRSQAPEAARGEAEAYSYERLPTTTSIRLVRVEDPRVHCERKICISLRTVELDAKPQYDALSYTWGRPLTVFASAEVRDDVAQSEFEVLCNGSLLKVGENLHRFLRHWENIQYASPDLKREAVTKGLDYYDEFWIDAISINQHDADEKSS